MDTDTQEYSRISRLMLPTPRSTGQEEAKMELVCNLKYVISVN